MFIYLQTYIYILNILHIYIRNPRCSLYASLQTPQPTASVIASLRSQMAMVELKVKQTRISKAGCAGESRYIAAPGLFYF